MIRLLVPTRGRPRLCDRMIRSARDTSYGQIMVDVAVADDDTADRPTEADTLTVTPAWPTVHSWNMLAGLHKADLFMLCSDDVIFTTPGWDEALLEHYNSLENKIHVYAFQDSRDPEGTPHPIVTKEYMDAMCYFMPPIFMHWFVDTWTVEIAKANGCFTHLKDYVLVHDKPSDFGKPDETHSRIRRMGWHERDRYVNRACQDYLQNEKERLSAHIAGGVLCAFG